MAESHCACEQCRLAGADLAEAQGREKAVRSTRACPGNQILIIGSTRFLVATGWTDYTSTGDYNAAMRICAEWMSDFKRIRIGEGYRKLRPTDLIGRDIATRDFLSTELAKGFNGKTVVISHHCPIQDVAGEGYEGHLGAVYFNQWHDLVSQADI